MVVDGRGFTSTREYLLALIEDFLDETGMAPTRFSVAVTKSPNLVTKLKGGKDVTTDTYDRCIRAMDVFRARQLTIKKRKKYEYRKESDNAT